MDMNEYQDRAGLTAIYPREYAVVYPALGLANEAGEVLGKIKKVLRDSGGHFDPVKRAEIGDEIGDVLWYIAVLAGDLKIPLEQIAQRNLAKLQSRQERGALSGSGDNR